MSNSLHVTESFVKTVLLECINERYQVHHYDHHHHHYTMTVLLEYIDRSLQSSTNT